MGTKPRQLARFVSVNERQRQAYASHLERLNPILEARRYATCLSRESVATKAQVAAFFNVSRPRVTQHMNLLKLPKPIQDYLLEHDDEPVIRGYFTERRLRPLTYLDDNDDIVRRFKAMVEEAHSAPGIWSEADEKAS